MAEGKWSARGWGLRLLAVALWAGTSALGFVEILAVRAIVLRIFVHFTGAGSYWGGHALGVATAIIMGVACVGVIIAGGEYHVKHFGKPESWQLFRRTIAVELAVLLLGWYI